VPPFRGGAPVVACPAVTSAPYRNRAGSWFADWIAKGAAPLVGSQAGSVRVRTTLMPDLQNLAQQVVDDALDKQGRRLGVAEGALAMRPDGAVLAMVGGRDYRTSQFNRAVDANRQPGSAFKLFVYLSALRKGYTPQDTIDAGPVDIKGWEPENFDDEHYGRITLADAFARSVNTAAVRLAMDVGLDNVTAAVSPINRGDGMADRPVPSTRILPQAEFDGKGSSSTSDGHIVGLRARSGPRSSNWTSNISRA
jgi:penicillin-binding protein 1A